MSFLQNLRLRKEDIVQVIAGRDKGRSGKILSVDLKKGRVVVEKLNMVKRHMKPTQKSPQGGIVEKELPIPVAKVLLFCAKCNRGVRHGIKILGEKKTRHCKKCDQAVGHSVGKH